MPDIEILINRFGPLRNIQIKWAPFMVITGHSNLGKSYANYLVYYLLSNLLGDGLVTYIRSKISEGDTEGSADLTYSEINEYLDTNVQDYMRSFLGDDLLECDVKFNIKGKDESFHYEYTKIVKESPIKELPQEISYVMKVNNHNYSYTANDYFSPAFYFAYYTIRSIVGANYIRAILLPPGRGAFVGENYTIKDRVSSAVGMYREYFNDYDYSQGKDKEDEENEDDKYVFDIISSLVGGKFVSEKSKQYILLSSGEKLSLTAAASSIKEISPLLFCFLNRNKYNYLYCLEEPEAHLHPISQIKISDLIANFLNRGNCFQITTHSDYFLQRINQLIKLGDIRKKNINVFNELCEERHLMKSSYIDRDIVKAYYFQRDDKGNVKVSDLPLTENGISYNTFYDATVELNEREDYINDKLYSLEVRE